MSRFRTSKDLPQLQALEDNLDVIMSEFRTLQEADKDTDPDYNRNGAWRFFAFHRHFKKNDGCCELCPQTVKLIESLGKTYSSGYSTLAANNIIRRHTDSQTLETVRVHLPLQVGTGPCRFQVEDEWIDWSAGKAFAFNPLLPHEGYNQTDMERIILLIDYESLYVF